MTGCRQLTLAGASGANPHVWFLVLSAMGRRGRTDFDDADDRRHLARRPRRPDPPIGLRRLGQPLHRLAERAVVAPVLASPSSGRNPSWWIAHDKSVVAVERLTSIPVERLLERHGAVQYATVRAMQRTIGWLAGLDR